VTFRYHMYTYRNCCASLLSEARSPGTRTITERWITMGKYSPVYADYYMTPHYRRYGEQPGNWRTGWDTKLLTRTRGQS
jgi:hypothetical protein